MSEMHENLTSRNINKHSTLCIWGCGWDHKKWTYNAGKS